MTEPGNKKWRISYHPSVVKRDIKLLDKKTANRVKVAIENKLETNPILYGVPLRGALKRYFKLRVGDWRVIYSLSSNDVLILIIGNRKDVYKLANQFLN